MEFFTQHFTRTSTTQHGPYHIWDIDEEENDMPKFSIDERRGHLLINIP